MRLFSKYLEIFCIQYSFKNNEQRFSYYWITCFKYLEISSYLEISWPWALFTSRLLIIFGSFHTKWCKVFEAWVWPISEFDKNLPGFLQYIRYDNPENFCSISCMDLEKFLFKVSNDRLKAPKMGVQSKFIWFLELYISGVEVLILEG